MRIDSHVYFSEAHPPEHLLAILQRNRFDGAILFVNGPELPAVPDRIAGLVVREIGFVPNALDGYANHPGFRGICSSLEHVAPNTADELAQRGIPLDVDMRSHEFPALLRLVEQVPALRLVIDHMARPSFRQGITDEWARGMESAAQFPQVLCKISGLLAEEQLPWSAAPIRPFVQHVLTLFGPSRLMFGSQWPVRLPEVIWKESLAAFTQSIGAQTMEAREQLLGQTAVNFYGIRNEV